MTGLRVQVGAVEPIVASFLDADGEGITGLSPRVTIRRSDGQFWDGSSSYAASPTSLVMSEVDATNRPGEYEYLFDTTNVDEGWHGIRATASASAPWPAGVQNPLQVGEIHVGEFVENVDATISSRADAATTNAGITSILNLDNSNTTAVLDAIAALNDPDASSIAAAVLAGDLTVDESTADSLARGVALLLDLFFGDTRIDRTNQNQWVEEHLDRATGTTVVARYDLLGLDGSPISDANNPFDSPTDQNAAFMRRSRTLGTP